MGNDTDCNWYYKVIIQNVFYSCVNNNVAPLEIRILVPWPPVYYTLMHRRVTYQATKLRNNIWGWFLDYNGIAFNTNSSRSSYYMQVCHLLLLIYDHASADAIAISVWMWFAFHYCQINLLPVTKQNKTD